MPQRTFRLSLATGQQEGDMTLRQVLFTSVAAIGIAAFRNWRPTSASARAVAIDNDDIGAWYAGPEAGVGDAKRATPGFIPARSRRPLRSPSTTTTSAASGSERPEAGVWVIAETTDLPPLHQDRRHRRPGPLRHPRPAEGQLQRVGARLRPRRFAEGEERARQAAQPDRGARAQRGGRREILPGDLLVLDDEDPRGQESSAARTRRTTSRSPTISTS